ncbi:MAG: hypothetical protein HYX27_20520 [Acidobacteria bacterium]|nr:hypothetical protein [Acidobacteriota bacterium]
MPADLIVGAMALYAGLGFWFALAFVTMLLPRHDPAARNTSIAFRLLAFPAAMLLWPLVAWAWRRKAAE